MHKLTTNQKCWLIADSNGRVPTLVAQFARLRGLEVLRHSDGQELAPSDAANSLIAIGFPTLQAMTSRRRESLGALVNNGATLYIRGDVEAGVRYHLAPLVDSAFSAARAIKMASYRFTDDAMIPAVLRGEEASFNLVLNFASASSSRLDPILFARDETGADLPVVFANRVGRGAIICDLQPDDETSRTPLIWRMSDPVQRCINVSALIAADRAAGRDLSRKVPFNVTIDDIPLGYDYLNEPILEEFFVHIEARCAAVHLDCAWIPTSQRISRRYVDILKNHGAGFLWHGMHRHINHQMVENPAVEMEAGKRAMALNAARYGVQFQPVIIFPFEHAQRGAEELLQKEGFLAGAEQPRHDEGVGMPEYLRYSDEACVHESGLRFLHRYEAAFLSRDRMLALGSFGMPILAFGHPKDVRLRRLSQIVERGGSFSHFDEVLDFASEKGLGGQSLEQLARELPTKPELVRGLCAQDQDPNHPANHRTSPT